MEEFDQLDPRNELARIRTTLANERTVLAYGRTALMVAVSGASLFKFFADQPFAIASGWILMGIGGLVAGLGLVRFIRLRAQLRGS